jgi:hypothetical protein
MAGAGRDHDEARDHARGEAEDRRLTACHPLDEHPRVAAAAAATCVFVNAIALMPMKPAARRRDGDRRAGVEAEPAEPQQPAPMSVSPASAAASAVLP